MTKVIRAKAGTRPTRTEITAGIDKTGSVVIVDNAHHEVHEGHMYTLHRLVEDLGNNNNIDIYLYNITKDSHTVWFHTCGGDALFYLYENPTVSNNGTLLPTYNINRASDNQASLSAAHTPTVSGVGTEIIGHSIPGGTGGNASGAMLRSGTEFVMAPGRTYLFRLTNVSGQAKDASIVIEFYEESLEV